MADIDPSRGHEIGGYMTVVNQNIYAVAKESDARLNKELLDLHQKPIPGVSVKLYPEFDVQSWHLCIKGPAGTAFEQGRFKVHLQFSDKYPQEFPAIKFLTAIHHPGVV